MIVDWKGHAFERMTYLIAIKVLEQHGHMKETNYLSSEEKYF